MEFLPKVQLAPYTSFALPSVAGWFCQVKEKSEISEALDFAKSRALDLMVLGAGSNLVLTRDFPGLVIKMDIAGIRQVDDEPGSVLIRLEGGQDWSSAVEFCLNHGWYGLENLAMIPGTAGAAPVQNIGAYGVEISDKLFQVQAVDMTNGKDRTFSSEECDFGYRASRFKQELDRWIVTSITIRLHEYSVVDTSYKALAAELKKMHIEQATPQNIYKAVCSIRRAKLPDPSKAGNVGSFFLNPMLSVREFNRLKEKHGSIAAFPMDSDRVKIAAAWLIDQCGFKGFKQGPVGIHRNQPLVLVNNGRATGQQVIALADKIRQTVQSAFGISLEYEPRIV